jgi:glycogen synthase
MVSLEPCCHRSSDELHTFVQAGILTSDKLLTVSPNYAAEMASNSSKGVELDDIIRWC